MLLNNKEKYFPKNTNSQNTYVSTNKAVFSRISLTYFSYTENTYVHITRSDDMSNKIYLRYNQNTFTYFVFQPYSIPFIWFTTSEISDTLRRL